LSKVNYIVNHCQIFEKLFSPITANAGSRNMVRRGGLANFILAFYIQALRNNKVA